MLSQREGSLSVLVVVVGAGVLRSNWWIFLSSQTSKKNAKLVYHHPFARIVGQSKKKRGDKLPLYGWNRLCFSFLWGLLRDLFYWVSMEQCVRYPSNMPSHVLYGFDRLIVRF